MGQHFTLVGLEKALNNMDEEDVRAHVQALPLSNEVLDTIVAHSWETEILEWAFEELSPKLLPQTQNPQWWAQWSATVPDLDALLLLYSNDVRWLDVLNFRWTTPSGQPEGSDIYVDRLLREQARDEVERMMDLVWTDGIIFNKVPLLERLFERPRWKARLTDRIKENLCFRKIEVWETFVAHNEPLPWSMLWSAAMAVSQLPQLNWLAKQDHATPEWVLGQYLANWKPRSSLPTEQPMLDFYTHHMKNAVFNAGQINMFHKNLVDSYSNFFKSTAGSWFDPSFHERFVLDVSVIPHFSGLLFIRALNDLATPPFFLSEQGSAGWEFVNTLLSSLSDEEFSSLKLGKSFSTFPRVQKNTLLGAVNATDDTATSFHPVTPKKQKML